MMDREPDVICTACGAEIQAVASSIDMNGEHITMKAACDCKSYISGDVPASWKELPEVR